MFGLFLLTLLCHLLSCLPLTLLYCIADIFYVVLYHLIEYRKKVVNNNLKNSFKDKTAHECKTIAKDFYQHLSYLLFEHIKALTITPKRLLKHVTIHNRENIEKFYKQGQSIILVSGHFGNWEWIAHALALETSYTIYAGYQPLNNKSIDRLVLHLRRRFQRKALPMVSLFRHMMAYKGPPQAVTLLIDQAPVCKENGYVMTFLNQKTTISLTAARLAQKLGQPIFYIQINSIKRGVYEAKPILLTETPGQLSTQAIAASYMKQLEADILRNPRLWLWSHQRWK